MLIASNSRIYILGAGMAGRAIAKEILAKRSMGRVVAFLDDDPAKIGERIDSIPVLGPIRDVVSLIKRSPADIAFIALPGIGKEAIRELYELLIAAGFIRILIVPDLAQILEGDAHLVQAREIRPEDVLGRSPVAIGLIDCLEGLKGKRVLVTGAGGSIGSEICRQMLDAGVERLYLFGHGEASIHCIEKELELLQQGGVGVKTQIVPVIGELKDASYMRFIMQRLKCDVVFHAAAYKHVPLMERNPVAVMENNVLGTRNLIEACLASDVGRFALISTDKAVEPSSMYGASKKISELLALDAARRAKPGTAYMVVRFGNVLGSRGSIMPLFKGQIDAGGPVTITDPRAKRFFMTIPEACSLVIKAAGIGTNGSLYVLDMGEAVSIRELAEQMIRFYGYQPDVDIRIEYIGMRPGERLEEKLWSGQERPMPSGYARILSLASSEPEADLTSFIEKLEGICSLRPGSEETYRDRRALRSLVSSLLPSVPEVADEPRF